MRLPRRLTWMVLILLIASFLRLHDLPQIPPGMTHDEADHGLDAWGVVQGQRPLYFTVGYGREPLFDYSTGVLMTFLGPSFLAGRFTSVFFSLILIAATYAWVRRALDGNMALLTAAGLALGFWPLMTARQALRSETLPAVLVLGMGFLWEGRSREKQRLETGDWRLEISQSLVSRLRSPYFFAGLFFGLAFYTYIPSRILWLLVPGLGLYGALARRRRPWRGVMVTLAIAALVGLPLFAYLWANPGAEVRVEQLALPLQQAMQGDLTQLWANVRSGLGIFTIAGDDQWRYNIAGRPLLSPLAGVFFYAGLLYATWQSARCVWMRDRATADVCRQAPGLFVALLWLALGLAPVLVTGRSLSTTQAIGLQPVLYLFPALVLTAGARRFQPWLEDRVPAQGPILLTGGALLLGSLLLTNTWRAYFQTWARHPEVAVQYEAELVGIIRSLEGIREEAGSAPVSAAAISTDAPGPFHDAATGRLFLESNQIALQWFDGRHSLLFPAAEDAVLLFSASAPLHQALAPYLDVMTSERTTQGPTGIVYEVTHSPGEVLHLYPQFSTEINRLSTELSTEMVFGDVVRFMAYELQTPRVTPGGVVRLATVWEVQEAPADELIFFTHLTDGAGAPLVQADRLDVPTHTWRAGDVFIQLHTLQAPADLAPGSYALVAGIYDAADWRRRLPVQIDGETAGELLPLTTVIVEP